MVGCWFTGQGKKGDCVGKKVNGGPVQLASPNPTLTTPHRNQIFQHEVREMQVFRNGGGGGGEFGTPTNLAEPPESS